MVRELTKKLVVPATSAVAAPLLELLNETESSAGKIF